jgi:hypothetical protein
MYCYFSVHFNDVSENIKIEVIIKLKNQIATHHAVFTCNKFPSVTVRSDGVISVEYRPTNFNLYLQILDRR